MALGGGTFIAQNKVLPGTYINFVSATSTSESLGERGVVAIALSLGKSEGSVIEITAEEFVTNSTELLGKAYSDDSLKPLREIFRHATKAVIYDLGSAKGASDAVAALEAYEFNVLCCYSNIASDITTYTTIIKSWRETYGKKVIGVVYNTDSDSEGVINVVSTVSDNGEADYSLVAWVAGAEAGCDVNESATNMVYDGEYTVTCDKTQSQLETCIKSGQFVFHLVYGSVRVLEDINSLTTTTADKGEDFKANQTIRVIDQIANDIAKLFNQKYLGKIPNNDSGRSSLWADIVEHHRELVQLDAIEDFDTADITVEAGDTKSSVVVNDAITPVNCMDKIYMTVVIS